MGKTRLKLITRKLNLALAVRCFGDHSGRGAGDSAIEQDRVRSIKVRVVQDVEEYPVQGYFRQKSGGGTTSFIP